MTNDPGEWLADWLQTDMTGDETALRAFITGLLGGAVPDRRLGNLYAASITADGLLLENLMQDDWPPVLVPRELALQGLVVQAAGGLP